MASGLRLDLRTQEIEAELKLGTYHYQVADPANATRVGVPVLRKLLGGRRGSAQSTRL